MSPEGRKAWRGFLRLESVCSLGSISPAMPRRPDGNLNTRKTSDEARVVLFFL